MEVVSSSRGRQPERCVIITEPENRPCEHAHYACVEEHYILKAIQLSIRNVRLYATRTEKHAMRELFTSLKNETGLPMY